MYDFRRRIIGFLAVVTLLVVSCTSASNGPIVVEGWPVMVGSAGNAAKPQIVVIGGSESKTGKLKVEASQQWNGFRLWLKMTNAAGGIRLHDGTIIQFATKIYDDESNKDRAKAYYKQLINEDRVDYLLNPYSSGLTTPLTKIVSDSHTLMFLAGAAADSIHAQGARNIFMVQSPASQYLADALNLLAEMDGSVRRIAVLHEDEPFSNEVAAALGTFAQQRKYQIDYYAKYSSNTTDFSAQLDALAATKPGAILGGGHLVDTLALAQQLRERGVRAKFVSLLIAPPDPKFAELGNLAVGMTGPSPWEPLAQYSPISAAELHIPWFGPTIQEFVEAYKAEYKTEPSYRAAAAFATGLVLQKAMLVADSVDRDAVRSVLERMDMMTFYGRCKFSTDADNYGLQVGHRMMVVQWQKNAAGELVKEVVYPKQARSAPAVYPMP